jgi:hypothetical protein
MKEYLQKILLWRKNAPAIQNGKLTHYVPENGVYVLLQVQCGTKGNDCLK